VTHEEPADQLYSHERFKWAEGMRDVRGIRIVDLELWDPSGPPDLRDSGTAGILIGQLDETGLLSDIVKQDGEWIVAVELGGDLRGFASDTLGEAAAWALLAVWDAQEPDLESA
jgi:hypothetical protein